MRKQAVIHRAGSLSALKDRETRDGIQPQQQAPVSEIRYRSLVHAAIHGFCRVRFDGTLLEGNPALAEMLGYESETSLIGLNLKSDVYLYPVEAVSTFEQLRVAGGIRGAEVQWKRTDGQHLTVRISGRKGVAEQENSGEFEIFTEDVTALRELERQLRQAQKMEAMGRLAGCIAHDFTNLLGVVLGYCELLSDKIAGDTEISHPLNEIKKAGQRAAALTEQLLAFSRQHVIVPKLLDVNAVVNEAMNLFYRAVGEDVEITVNLESGLALVRADSAQLIQAIIYLAMHARDSMSAGGGSLTLSTSMRDVDDCIASQHTPMLAGSYVVLEIRDTGKSLNAEAKSRVFEPFYSTKELRAGNGIGLAAVYGIVKQNAGYIWVDSTEVVGSTFKIFLPVAAHGEVLVQEKRSQRKMLEDLETVLVVEDIPALRELIVGFLRESGYSPIAATNGEDALSLAKDCDHPIHLMLADVVMPGIGGPQLAQILAASRPEIRVLYMSGYTEDPCLRDELAAARVAFVKKPFSRQVLINKVREVLDACA